MLFRSNGAGAGTVHAALDQGRPACDYCRMMFSDPAFGAEIAMRNGTRKIYDAVECMAAAVLTDSVPQRDIRAIRLVDHDLPHALLPLDRTVFGLCPSFESPMGLSLAAFGTRERAEHACRAEGSRVLDWRGVLTHVNTTWFQGRLAVEPHAGTHAPRSRAAPRAVTATRR